MSTQQYLVTPPTTHRKVRDGERITTAIKYGSRTKYRVAVVKRRRTVNGERTYTHQIFIDPRANGESGRFTSPEAYEVNVNKFTELKSLKNAAFDKVIFKFMTRDGIRDIRRRYTKILTK